MIVKMREDGDCEEASIATAAGVTWEEAHEALLKVDLPGKLEDPVFGNPINVQHAIERLGFKAIRRTFTDIVTGIAKEQKTVILIHFPDAPTLKQHWVVLNSVSAGAHHISVHWGNGMIKSFKRDEFLALFTDGFPNAAWEVGPKIKIWWFHRFINWLRSWFK